MHENNMKGVVWRRVCSDEVGWFLRNVITAINNNQTKVLSYIAKRAIVNSRV